MVQNVTKKYRKVSICFSQQVQEKIHAVVVLSNHPTTTNKKLQTNT